MPNGLGGEIGHDVVETFSFHWMGEVSKALEYFRFSGLGIVWKDCYEHCIRYGGV